MHPLFNMSGQVGIYIVIVFNGIRRTRFTLHNSRVIPLNAVCTVIGLRGVFNDSCVPNMCDSQFFYFTERFGREIIKLTTPIGFQAAVVNAVIIVVAKKAG